MPALLLNTLHRVGQQVAAVGPPRWRASESGYRRPMSPSTAAPSSASGDRVQQHVRIRVSEQALLVFDRHAAQHEATSRHQRMHVESLPDPISLNNPTRKKKRKTHKTKPY